MLCIDAHSVLTSRSRRQTKGRPRPEVSAGDARSASCTFDQARVRFGSPIVLWQASMSTDSCTHPEG
jgi:hypothetical protein